MPYTYTGGTDQNSIGEASTPHWYCAVSDSATSQGQINTCSFYFNKGTQPPTGTATCYILDTDLTTELAYTAPVSITGVTATTCPGTKIDFTFATPAELTQGRALAITTTAQAGPYCKLMNDYEYFSVPSVQCSAQTRPTGYTWKFSDDKSSWANSLRGSDPLQFNMLYNSSDPPVTTGTVTMPPPYANIGLSGL